MVRSKELRRRAYGKLANNWGTMILATIVYGLLGGFAGIIVDGPLSYGRAKMALDVVRGKSAKVETLFDGFGDFVKLFILGLLINIFTFLWTLLFIIPGIIKSYSYSMSYYISVDNPSLSADEARVKSMALMKGNKWRLFCLELSFIGWILLTIITFGLAGFFVGPYMQVATAEFYGDLVGDTAAKKNENAGAQSGIFCSECGAASPSDAAFCGKCGAKLARPQPLGVKYCTQCGAASPSDAMFCGKCGNKLGGVEHAAITCPACGAKNDASAAVCTQCGRKLPVPRNWND